MVWTILSWRVSLSFFRIANSKGDFGGCPALYFGLKCKVAMNEVKLSSKNQIVVPREAREALGAKPGSRLLLVVRNGTVTLLAKPKNYAKAIRGLSKKRYPRDYVKTERSSWR